MGPALGLMGTLIPLSPALAALAEGDVQRLTDDLRVAFSVTVVGLLVGMIAFAVSLVRDRLYAQDYSDVEYVLAGLSSVPIHPSPKAPPTGEAKAAATEVAQTGATAAVATVHQPPAPATPPHPGTAPPVAPATPPHPGRRPPWRRRALELLGSTPVRGRARTEPATRSTASSTCSTSASSSPSPSCSRR